MEGKENGIMEKVLEEHIKRVFELYKSKTTSLRNTYRILFSFAILFLLIILIPYVSIKGKNVKVGRDLAELSSQITHREKYIAQYEKVQDGINKVQDKIKNGPRDLRRFIERLHEDFVQSRLQAGLSASPERQYGQTVTPHAVALDEEMLNLEVKQEVERQFAEYGKILKENIYDVLQELAQESEALNINSQLVIDLQFFITGLDTLAVNFTQILSENPHFWESFTGKEAFFLELEQAVAHFWNKRGPLIEAQSKEVRKDLSQLKEAKIQLTEHLEQLQNREQQLSERLEQIEFPFGRLPIGLGEAIAVFPILLVIGFFGTTSLLLETMRLRYHFHRLYKRKDPHEALLTDEQIMLIAPRWIEPVNFERKNLGRLIVYSIPFLIFIVACILILYCWTLPSPLANGGHSPHWLYAGLYACCFVLFLNCFGRIFKGSSRYSCIAQEDSAKGKES